MQNLEYNHEDFEEQSVNVQDANLLVKFIMRRKPSTGEMAEYVDIKVPGTRGGTFREVRTTDITRFPRHYAAFKKRMEMPVDGTPLLEWGMITAERAQELSFFNVKTVEQLATLSDTHSDKFMGIEILKQQARDWLEEESERKQSGELKAELAKRDETIAALTARLDVLDKPKRKYTKKAKVTPETEVEDGAE